MENHIFPAIGHLPVTTLKTQHFTALLRVIFSTTLWIPERCATRSTDVKLASQFRMKSLPELNTRKCNLSSAVGLKVATAGQNLPGTKLATFDGCTAVRARTVLYPKKWPAISAVIPLFNPGQYLITYYEFCGRRRTKSSILI